MAKKNAKEAVLKDLSVQELEAHLLEFQEKNFKLRFQHAANPQGPIGMEIHKTRRQIARIKTFLHQKQKVQVA